MDTRKKSHFGQLCASDGVPKRSWPKKPIRPRKPKISSNLEPAEGNDEQNDDDNGDDDDD
jgi:hypothetical protein